MSKKTTTQTKPFNPAAINNAQNTLNSTVAANAPQLAANAGLIDQQLPGMAQRAFSPDPTVSAAQGYDQNVLNGQYLGQSNPYLSGMIDQTDRGVTDRVNSQFGMGGRTGSVQQVDALGRQLADSENGLRYQDYANERNAMGQAAANAPQLNAGQYAGIQPYLAATQAGSSLPYLGAQTLASGTQGLQSPWNTTTQQQSPLTTIGNIAGLGMMAFGAGGPFASVFGGGKG